MLPVSDLLDLARRGTTRADVGSRAPQRYAPPGSESPVIVWNVCRHCNMSCPHCYAAASFRPDRHELSTDEALHLLDELAGCGVRIVIFSGGEPMLRPDLYQLASHARNLGIAPQLSTNGVLVDEEAARRLADAGFAYVGISIDGTRDFNDDYRGLAGGYEAALEGLRCAKAVGMRTGLRMTLTSHNADQTREMLQVAREARVDRFYVSHLLYSGRARRMATDDLGRQQARDLLHDLFAQAEALLDQDGGPRIVTGSNDSDGPLLLRWIERRYGEAAAQPVRALLDERGGNSAGEKILNIDHRGRVHPDQFWRGVTLGDVRRQSFASILEHPFRKLLAERSHHLTGRCGACSYRELCRGSHRERALAQGGDLWAPDPACVLEDDEVAGSTPGHEAHA